MATSLTIYADGSTGNTLRLCKSIMDSDIPSNSHIYIKTDKPEILRDIKIHNKYEVVMGSVDMSLQKALSTWVETTKTDYFLSLSDEYFLHPNIYSLTTSFVSSLEEDKLQWGMNLSLPNNFRHKAGAWRRIITPKDVIPIPLVKSNACLIPYKDTGMILQNLIPTDKEIDGDILINAAMKYRVGVTIPMVSTTPITIAAEEAKPTHFIQKSKSSLDIVCLLCEDPDPIISPIIEGLHELGHNTISNHTGNNINTTVKDIDALLKRAKEADLVLAFHYGLEGAYVDIDDSLHTIDFLKEVKRKIPIVLIDGSYSPYYQPLTSSMADIIFKKEAVTNITASETRDKDTSYKSYPIVFPCRTDNTVSEQSFSNRDISVLGLFSHTDSYRKDVVQKLVSLQINNSRIGLIDLPISFKDYRNLLTRSKIGISVRSMGYDTPLYWEILLSGACLLSEEPSIDLIGPPPISDKEVVYFSSLEDLEKKITDLLSNPKKMEAIALAGTASAKKRHMPVNRARYIIDTCKKEGIV